MIACAEGSETSELDNAKLREANSLEFSYSYLAADLKMTELCEKISPNAYLAAAFNPPGLQVSFTRSDCYFNVAVETRNAALCERVRTPVEFPFLDGSEETPTRCRAEVAKGRGLQGSGGDNDWLLRFMGNPSEGLVANGVFVSWRDPMTQYRYRKQALGLPDFSRPDGRVVSGNSYESIGCRQPDDPDWACFAYRCFLHDAEDLREACLEIATYVKVRQEAKDHQHLSPMTGYHQTLLKQYPQIKLPEME